MNDSLWKLFQGVCLDWSVTEEEYNKRGLDVEQYGQKMTYDEILDWIIGHIVEKYGKNT